MRRRVSTTTKKILRQALKLDLRCQSSNFLKVFSPSKVWKEVNSGGKEKFSRLNRSVEKNKKFHSQRKNFIRCSIVGKSRADKELKSLKASFPPPLNFPRHFFLFIERISCESSTKGDEKKNLD